MITTSLFRLNESPTAPDMTEWPGLCQDDENLLWVDLQDPSDAELAEVMEHLDIDPRALDTCRREDRRPSVRFYRNHSLVTSLAVDVDPTEDLPRLTATPLDLFVGRNFLVSLHRQSLPFAQELEERTSTHPRLGRLDATYLLYLILDTMVWHYTKEFEEVEDQVELLEEQLLRDPGRDALDKAVRLKHHINDLRSLIAPHREAFGVLIAGDFPPAERRMEGYFRDLLAHLGSLIDRIDHVRDIVTGSYNLYISNVGQRTNQQLRVLTFLSAVLLPMTVIAGLFGTNFTLSEYTTAEGFYVMLAGMVLITVALLVFFHRRHWL